MRILLSFLRIAVTRKLAHLGAGWLRFNIISRFLGTPQGDAAANNTVYVLARFVF
jgi:hypothetical protein